LQLRKGTVNNFFFHEILELFNADHFPDLSINDSIPLNISTSFRFCLTAKEEFQEGVFEMSLLLFNAMLSNRNCQSTHVDLLSNSS